MNSNPIALGLLFFASIAQSQDRKEIYLGTTPASGQKDVAILVVNRPQPRGGDFKCNVTAINRTRSEGTGQLPEGVVLVVLTPGTYRIGTVFQTHLRNGFAGGEKTFEAGKRYEVHCAGRTYHQMKVEARLIED